MHAVRLCARTFASVVALLSLTFAVNAFAQGGTATISGTVYDNVGVVPGAAVTARNVSTNDVRSVTTNEVGVFRFSAMPPGTYTVKVEVQGFKPLTVEEFTLLAADSRDFNRLVLQAGGVQESVSVIAQVTPVQVTESSRKQGITSDQIQNITMKGRDIYGFLSTLPGVIDTNLNRDYTSWTSAATITINGAPVTSNNIMVDGIAQRDESGTNAMVNPNMDAIGEVQVIANGFTAENGRSNGGLVNFVTKSGTTTFKGSGWYNARRDAWNKNDYIRIRNNSDKPLYRVNISGFSIGGPVIIPKVLDSRTSQRKVFFFVSQEFTDDARPTSTSTANYPTELERAGNFSQTYQTTSNAYGQVLPILDYTNVVNNVAQPFPGNIIPAARINPIGQKMLNLMLLPNGYVPPGTNQQYNANFKYDETPLHQRIDYVYRTDIVMTKNLRFSGRFLANKEDNITVNAYGPGFGRANNFVPGWQISATNTYVLNPTTVNEINGGFVINHYAYRGYPDGYDYTQYYCANLGVCPPRITPWEKVDKYHPDAPPEKCCAFKQADQYPYISMFSTSGGNRAGLANYSPGASNGRVMPTSNRNHRWQFQDDLSKTVGRHALKFGFYSELQSKTEPGTTSYMGNYNFGSSSNNPRDTGYGYANMLLGVVTSYQEATIRVDKDVRHWQNEGYAQDSWRLNSRLTLDYGLRFTHSGSWYEVNHSTAAFFPELYDPTKAARLYRPACTTANYSGDQACSAGNTRSVDPAFPNVLLPSQLTGTVVPGSGDFLNGMVVDGLKGNGSYYNFPALQVAPRVGMAWDVNGDGRSAIRSSFGVFYNVPRTGVGQQFVGTPPVSFNQTVNNTTFEDIAAFSTGGSQLTFTNNPISSAVAYKDRKTYGLPLSYNANVAYQKDIGFSTVVEVAYVGNWTTHDSRNFNLEIYPYNWYADPAHQFNQATLDTRYTKLKFPGMNSITDFVMDEYSLQYNAMQVSVQRRLSKGLQLGLAYTLSKSMGMQGYDEYTADPSLTIPNVGGVRPGGKDALHDRYWGENGTDRRHNLTFNYSYQIPSPVRSGPLKYVLGDWQVSGVTKWITGTSANPSCGVANTVRGVQFTTPSLTPGASTRCDLTGEPINMGVRVDPDPSNPDPLDATFFNPGAFKLAYAVNGQGNFGNAPLGLLRNPSYSSWDLTFARRIPVKIGRNGGVRVQLQAYNLFNVVRFTSISTGLTFSGNPPTTQTSNSVAQYGNSVIPARQLGLTIRLDF